MVLKPCPWIFSRIITCGFLIRGRSNEYKIVDKKYCQLTILLYFCKKMNMDLKEFNGTLFELYDRLFSADDIKRNQACTEALGLIDKIESESHKNDVRKMIVFHLFDARRFQEAHECIKAMKQSDDYYYSMAGHQAAIEYCKICDIANLEQAIRNAQSLAKQSGHKADYAVCCMEHSKYLYQNGKYDDCIEVLGDVIVIAEELKNVRFELGAKYYTSLALYWKGHKDMALEMLREVSETACDVRSQHVAMFSELKRAEILSEVGRKDEALNILKQWCDNFETQL